MKQGISLLLVMQFFALALVVQAQEDHRKDDKKEGERTIQNAPPAQRAPMERKVKTIRKVHGRQPIAIHTEAPAQQNHPRPMKKAFQPQAQEDRTIQPAQRTAPGTKKAFAAAPRKARPSNTLAYDGRRLSRIGAKSRPEPIRDRSSILRADRAHSAIHYPQSGPKGEAIRGSRVSSRNFNNGLVRSQMSAVNSPSYRHQLDQERSNENQRGHSYWHNGNGFNYDHYVDPRGYHWYGWYRGDQYFWTRQYAGRWWWYDQDYDRWNYYQDNNWYWQDPAQPDEVYVYDNDSYISMDLDLNN